MIKIYAYVIMLYTSDGGLHSYPDNIPEMTREQCIAVTKIVNDDMWQQTGYDKTGIRAICVPRVEDYQP